MNVFFVEPAAPYSVELGELDLATASARVPHPTATPLPPFPPRGRDPGIVLVEVVVDETGIAAVARMVRSVPGFDQVALDTARRWRFRPARTNDQPTESIAYLLFGFAQPVTDP